MPALAKTPVRPRVGEQKRVPFETTMMFQPSMIDDVDGLGDRAKALSAKKGDLVLSGYANTWGLDRDGEAIHPNAFDSSLPDYLDKNPIILWQHDQDCPIGTMLSAETDATGLKVKVLIPKPAANDPDWLQFAYNSIQRGVVRTFSVGGYVTIMWDVETESAIIVQFDLLETSIVSIPANENSLFEVAVKAIKGIDVQTPHLTGAVISQMEQLTGIEEPSDPLLLSLDDDGRQKRHAALAAVYDQAGYEAPELDEFQKAAAVENPLERLAAVTATMTKAKGGVVVMKEGRSISKANEEQIERAVCKLTEATETLQSLLAVAPPEPAAAAVDHATIIEAAAAAAGGAA